MKAENEAYEKEEENIGLLNAKRFGRQVAEGSRTKLHKLKPWKNYYISRFSMIP